MPVASGRGRGGDVLSREKERFRPTLRACLAVLQGVVSLLFREMRPYLWPGAATSLSLGLTHTEKTHSTNPWITYSMVTSKASTPVPTPNASECFASTYQNPTYLKGELEHGRIELRGSPRDALAPSRLSLQPHQAPVEHSQPVHQPLQHRDVCQHAEANGAPQAPLPPRRGAPPVTPSRPVRAFSSFVAYVHT